MNFEDYTKSLSDIEILAVYKYRYEELNDKNKSQIESEIEIRKLSVANFSYLLKKQKEQSNSKPRCPRCFSDKVIPEQNNYDSFRGFYQLYLIAPWLLRLAYTCNICNKKFKKWPTIKQILKLPY